jgi:hypothetical protein
MFALQFQSLLTPFLQRGNRPLRFLGVLADNPRFADSIFLNPIFYVQPAALRFECCLLVFPLSKWKTLRVKPPLKRVIQYLSAVSNCTI